MNRLGRDSIDNKKRWLAVASILALFATLFMPRLRRAEAPAVRAQTSLPAEQTEPAPLTVAQPDAVRVDLVEQNGAPATTMDIPLSRGEILAGRISLNTQALDTMMRAGSSARAALRFPMASGQERVVELTGAKTLAEDRASWQAQGKVSGMPESRVVLTKWKGQLFGSVHALAAGEFEWRQQKDGSFAVIRFEPALLPGCQEEGDELRAEAEPGAPLAGAASPGSRALQIAALKSYVDVVVGYNDQARVALGGAAGNPADIAAIEAKILTSVANANIAYSDSAIGLEMRLAWMGLIAYDYPATESLDRALAEITNGADSKADELSRIKEEYGADFASLWIDSSASGGLATVITSPLSSNRAYSVIRSKNPTSTFVHELGHNMGCRHMRDSYSSTPSSWKPYGFASYFIGEDANGYVTVMASTEDQSRTGAVARLLRFPNPRVKYLGVPTGAANDTDCARSIEEVRPFLESFRQAPPIASVITLPFSSLRITLNKGYVAESYTLQRSIDLKTWTSLGTSTTDSSGALSRTDVGGRSLPVAFYKWLAAP